MYRSLAVILFSVSALVTGACGDDTGSGAVCTNGVLEAGEDCDTTQFRDDATCEVLGHSGGMLTCSSECTFDESGCTDTVLCGNDTLDATEDCDGPDLADQTCRSRGFASGTLDCSNDCTFDDSGCSGTNTCGNGSIESDEDCDGADLGSATCQSLGLTSGTLTCDADCGFDTSACTGCSDQCALTDDDQCVGSMQQECQLNTLTGCNEWVDKGDCSPQNCIVTAGISECSDTCQPQCSVGADDQCNGSVKQTCAVNPSTNCAEWTDIGDCDPLFCVVNASGDASCSGSTCINDCSAAGDLQCMNGSVDSSIEICAVGADTCLHWEVQTDCAAGGAVCDDSGATPQCSCPSAPCASGDVSCCNLNSSTWEYDSICNCVQSTMGCWMFEEQTDCTQTGEVCENNSPPTCECSWNNECYTVGEEYCSGDVRYRCESGSTGCLSYAQVEDCDAASLVCNDLGGTPSTTICGCQGDCTTVNERRCTGDVLERCDNVGTCLQWTTLDNCAANGETCDLWMGSPTCLASGQCTSTCTTPGQMQCNGQAVQTCTAQPNGCNEWVQSVDCAATNEYCDDSGATPVCASTCTDQCDINMYNSRCDGATQMQRCLSQGVCSIWVDDDDCADYGEVCVPNGEYHSECVEPCRNQCNLGEQFCMLDDNSYDYGIGTCTVGSQGCTVWETSQCPGYDDWCGEGNGTAKCYTGLEDPCDLGSEYPACDTAGDTRCLGNTVQQCSSNYGCLMWRDITQCPQTAPYCEQTNPTTAQCTSTCSDNCDIEGHSVCLTSGQIYACERNYDGCLDWILGANCAAGGDYCAMSGSQPATATCTSDGDNCSAVIPVTTDYFMISGEDFTLNYTSGFNLSSGTGCDTANGADAVFSVVLTAGQSMIIGEYGGLNAVMRVLDSCTATTCLLSHHEFNEDNPFTFTAPAAGTYYVVLESFSAFPSATDFMFIIQTLSADETGKCGDSLDNDGDGLTDCADAECYGDATYCGIEVQCDDGDDNDGDGLSDCADTDCQTSAFWCSGTEASTWECSDGLDNDGDGLLDCDDGDCANVQACRDNQGVYQIFDPTNNPSDLHGWRIVFTPGGTNGYTWAASQNAAYFVTPGITGNADSFQFGWGSHTITLPFAFPSWGTPTNTVHIKPSLGAMIFGDIAPDWNDMEYGGYGFFYQTLGMFWNPNGNSYEADPAHPTQYVDADYDSASSRFYWAYTFRALEDYTTNAIDVQVVLFDDGEIRMDFITVQITEGSVGLLNPGAWDSPMVVQTNFVPDLENTAAACNDGMDNDQDNNTDCLDSQCAGLGLCGAEASSAACQDRFDNDGDGDTDCADASCAGLGICGTEDHFTTCVDGHDNDGDGETDYFSDATCTNHFLWFEDLTTDPGWTNTGGWTHKSGGYYYLDGTASGYLEIGPVDLTSSCRAHLALEIFKIETQYWMDAIQVSTDQVTWSTAPMIYPAYSYANAGWGGGTALYWDNAVADLSAWAGNGTVYIRFNSTAGYYGSAIRNVGLALWNNCSYTTDYTQDFNSGAGGWTFTGEWEHGTPSNVGPTACASGSCIGTALAGNVNQYCWSLDDCGATSGAIDLSAISSPQLFFQGYIDTAVSYGDDGCNVFASADGINWSPINVTPAYNDAAPGGIGVWSGNSLANWQSFSADISFLGGDSTAYLRFSSGFWDSVGTNPGCYFDDLVIGHY